MSGGVSSNQPEARRGRRLFWGIVIVALAVLIATVAAFAVMLFGPGPPIVVSEETTYITSPLGEDGLPDYEEWVRQNWRGAATPDNNGGIPFWRAMWGGELTDPADQQLILDELGMERPAAEDILQRVYKQPWEGRLEEWVLEAHPLVLGEDFDPNSFDTGERLSEVVDDLIDLSRERPWTRDELPVMADWADANAQPFELLHKAGASAYYYPGSPSLLDGRHGQMVEILLPAAQGSREGARSLVARAMLSIGEGRLDDAWRDVHAVQQLGRHVADSFTMVHQLVGYAFENLARQGIVRVLASDRLDSELARRMLRDYQALKPYQDCLLLIAGSERLMSVDAVIAISSEGRSALEWYDLPAIPLVGFNWNLVLVRINEFFDMIEAAANEPEGPKRNDAVEQVMDTIDEMNAFAVSPFSTDLLFSRGARSERIADVLMSLLVPALEAALTAERRTSTQVDLALLAIALEVHRLEEGAYPARLEELVPGVLEELPVDPFGPTPYAYRITEDGYLIYSIGPNGKDDDGSNEGEGRLTREPMLEGRVVVEPDFINDDTSEYDEQIAKIPTGADDVPLRMPPPSPKPWPWEVVKPEAGDSSPDDNP